MRQYLLLLLVPFLFTACEEDAPTTNLLNYDGPNLEAPQFLPGDYQMAARFTPSETNSFQGRFLEEVQVHLDNRPARAEIIIYGEGTGNTPGPVLYSQVVTTEVRSNTWNTHVLTTPVEIPNGEDLWIAVMVRHRDAYGTVGCDRGPADNNGDILLTSDNQWTTLRDFTNQQIDINWNIRGVVGN